MYFHLRFCCLLATTAVFGSEASSSLPADAGAAPLGEIASFSDIFSDAKKEDLYTINYNTVSIQEYLKFASKICKANFIYNEEDLDFSVSIVSDAPINPENVMGTLLQVLRIHGLSLLEQDNNLVIHKADDVKQLATLVTKDQKGIKASIVTRVFRVKTIPVDSLAAIIRPMISSSALLETSPDPKIVILTDITTNVEKVAGLIEVLDTPHAPLEVQSYAILHNQPQFLLDTAMKLLAPIVKGDPFVLVPQPLANTIFIVSTPDLIERAKTILHEIDTPPKKAILSQRRLQAENIFVYKVLNRPGNEILEGLLQIGDSLHESGMSEGDLLETIETAKFIPQTNSLLFFGSADAIKKVQEFLGSLDSLGGGDFFTDGSMRTQFFLYKLENSSGDDVKKQLDQLTKDLRASGVKNPKLLDLLEKIRYVKETNSLLLTGSPSTIQEARKLIAEYDLPNQEYAAFQPSFFLYKLQKTTGEEIEEDLDALAKDLKESGVKNPHLLHVLEHARYIKETNAILLTGTPQAIEEAKKLLAEYDYPRMGTKPVSSSFLLYKPEQAPAEQIEKSLHEIAASLKKSDLADPALLAAIQSMKYVESTNSLIFTGTPPALDKLQTLLKDVDAPSPKRSKIQHLGKVTFLLYKLKHASGPQIISAIKGMSGDLKKSGTSDKDFILALQSVKFVKETNSLLFTGTPEALQRVDSFVLDFDVPSLAAPPSSKTLSTMAHSNFLAYKPAAVPGPDLEKMMSDFSENLKMSGLTDPELFSAIDSMRWADKTQSLIFTGTPKSLAEIKEMLVSFDIPSNAPSGTGSDSIQAIDNTSFLVYKLQFHKGDEIQGALRQIAKDLTQSNAPINQNLLQSIQSIQWLEVTNSLLCSGDQDTLVRLRELIKNLDIPLKQVYIEMLVIETSLTNALQFGLEWGGKYKYRNKFQGSINNTIPQFAPGTTQCVTSTAMDTLNNLVPASPASTITQNIPFGCGFDLGVIGQVIKHNGQTFLTLGSLLTAVQTDDESSVVITPKIITQDGKTSSIFVGQNVPFVGSFVNNQSQTVVQTSNLEYRDIGLNLTITPVLGNSDIVTLDISLDRTQTVGDVTGSAISFSTQSAQGITTSRTTMQTTVHVPDKNFLILSGFVNNSNAKSKAGIPCLGGLPIIGAAFSKDTDTVQNTNIVIFLRPHIINSMEDLKQLTADQENVFRDQQGTPFLIRQFEEGMELIKTIDDE